MRQIRALICRVDDPDTDEWSAATSAGLAALRTSVLNGGCERYGQRRAVLPLLAACPNGYSRFPIRSTADSIAGRATTRDPGTLRANPGCIQGGCGGVGGRSGADHGHQGHAGTTRKGVGAGPHQGGSPAGDPGHHDTAWPVPSVPGGHRRRGGKGVAWTPRRAAC